MKQAVLIVEDNRHVRERLIRMIQQRYGVPVYAAATLHEGRERAYKGPYRLALIDHYLPDGEGLSLVQNWPGTNGHSRPPCLIMTTLATPALREKVHQIPSLRFWDKTADPRELQVICDHYLGNPARTEAGPEVDESPAEDLNRPRCNQLSPWLQQHLIAAGMATRDIDIWTDPRLLRLAAPIPPEVLAFLDEVVGVVWRRPWGQPLFVFLTLTGGDRDEEEARVLLSIRFGGLTCPVQRALANSRRLENLLQTARRCGLTLISHPEENGTIRINFAFPVPGGQAAGDVPAAG
ncbi:MAG: response regulator [Opitutales bacterium]